MSSRARVYDPLPTGCISSQVALQSDVPWGVVLAGGDGTRLQPLTLQISGDTRPKQFCKLLGGESLLVQTSRRITPLFSRNRQMYVVTRAHEEFYRDELSTSTGVSILEQPCNRGTAVAIGVAVLRILKSEDDPLVAFFPSDHRYSNESAFLRVVNAALEFVRTNPKEIVLLAAEPGYPEVEYGWIEPGEAFSGIPAAPVFRVNRFWEKPSLLRARALLQKRCLWNTFVSIGRAAAFVELLRSQFSDDVDSIAAAVTKDYLDLAYRRLPSIDISREVFSPQPRRLLVFRDNESGWTDLGTPRRVLGTLLRDGIEPDWLSLRSLAGGTVGQKSEEVSALLGAGFLKCVRGKNRTYTHNTPD